jgi:catechol 2,3-dioxygenase-like lactoylglutathione lyase family enzyme
MLISAIDHLVLTVSDIPSAIAFYVNVLGMREERFGSGRVALSFGQQKFNLHDANQASEIAPVAREASPGSIDICLLAGVPLAQVMSQLEECGVAVELGPVPRTGATMPLRSIYIRDPDENLIEISEPWSEELD